MKDSQSDKSKLKAKLAEEEARSLLKAYPDYPRDVDGNIISNKKSSELILDPIAGTGNKDGKRIRDINRLISQYGGEENDYAKLSSKPRDINDGVNPKSQNIEFHGYKNIKNGELHEVKLVDSDKRAIEAKQKVILENIQSSTDKKLKKMSTKNEMLSQIKKNASDITSKSEALKKKLDDNKKDVTPTKKDIVANKFIDNRKEMTPTKKEILEKKFNENKKDILGDKGSDKKTPDKIKTEHKPDKPKLG